MTPLTMEAFNQGITPPAQRTLDTYGITQDEWIALLKAQGWVCPICLKGEDEHDGKKRVWNTDHEHVPGWKAMPPEERKRYVRGVLCFYCNHRRVNSRMASAEAQRIADYIAAYEARRDGKDPNVEPGCCGQCGPKGCGDIEPFEQDS